MHPWAGFAAGWTFLASKLAAGGTVAIGFGGYLARLIPGVSPQAAAVTAVIALTVANFMGIKKAGRLNIAIVAITLSSLVYFALSGLPAFRATNLQPFAPMGWSPVLRSAALLFFAYTGYARIATLAEEVRDPRRTIPKAIILSLSTAAVLYGVVALVALGAVGAEALSSSPFPIALAADRSGAPGAVVVVGVGAATAMLGVLLSQVLGISRVILAMSRRHDMPAFLGHVDPKNGVPDRAILLTGGIILVLAVFGTLEWIAASATFTILLYYTITNVAALRLERGAKLYSDWIPWCGLISCLVLAFSLQPRTILLGLMLVVVGFALRALFRRSKLG